MTTDTQQNTVFSTYTTTLAVKANEVKLSRCETGNRIHKEWSATMQETARSKNEGNWLNAWGKGYIPYKKHQLECIQCTNFDFQWLPVMGWKEEK